MSHITSVFSSMVSPPPHADVSASRVYENMSGEQAPVGFWDPAGFTIDDRVENIQQRRQAELSHGCISMLARMD